MDATEVIVSDFAIGGAGAYTAASNSETVIAYWVMLDDESGTSLETGYELRPRPDKTDELAARATMIAMIANPPNTRI